MHARFFHGDLAAFDQVGHERMVARDALQAAFVQKVGARIAHLGHYEAFARKHGAGHGGSHALAADAFGRRADHSVVRRHHGARQIVAVGRLGRVGDERLDGDFAGHFACGVAAHAVGHRIQRRIDGKAVFVMVAHQTDVGTRAV